MVIEDRIGMTENKFDGIAHGLAAALRSNKKFFVFAANKMILLYSI